MIYIRAESRDAPCRGQQSSHFVTHRVTHAAGVETDHWQAAGHRLHDRLTMRPGQRWEDEKVS